MLIRARLAPGTPELSTRTTPTSQLTNPSEVVLGVYLTQDITDSYQGRKDIFSNTSKMLTRSSSNIFNSSGPLDSPRTLQAKQEHGFLFCLSPHFRKLPIRGNRMDDSECTFYSQGAMKGFCIGGEHPLAETTANQSPQNQQASGTRSPLIWIDGKNVASGSKIDLNRIVYGDKPKPDILNAKHESSLQQYELAEITNLELWVFGDQSKKARVMSAILKYRCGHLSRLESDLTTNGRLSELHTKTDGERTVLDSVEEIKDSPELKAIPSVGRSGSFVQVGGQLVRKIYRGDVKNEPLGVGSIADTQKETEKGMFGFAGSIMGIFSDSPKPASTANFKVSVSPPMKSIKLPESLIEGEPEIKRVTKQFEIRPSQVAPQSSTTTNPPSTRNVPIPVIPGSIFESYVEQPKEVQTIKESLTFDPSQSFHPSAFGTKSSMPMFPDTGSSGHEHKQSKEPEDDEEM